MKNLRIFFCVTLLATATATFSVPGVNADTSDLTLEQILAKHYEARGGLDQIKSFQTMQIRGKFLSGGGTENPLAAYWKRPNWLRVEMDIQGAHFIKAYGGQDVWVISPWAGTREPQKDSPLDQKTWSLHADLDGPLVDWQDKDYTLELVGTDEVGGTAVHHLRLATAQDVTIEHYMFEEYMIGVELDETIILHAENRGGRGHRKERRATLSGSRGVYSLKSWVNEKSEECCREEI